MSDLIDRQELRKDITTSIDYCEDILEIIDRQPSAEPKIIRCKDCKYWETEWQNSIDPSMHYCPMTDHSHEGDFYCADAEMRGEGNE